MTSRKFLIYGFLITILIAAIATLITLFLVLDNDEETNGQESE